MTPPALVRCRGFLAGRASAVEWGRAVNRRAVKRFLTFSRACVTRVLWREMALMIWRGKNKGERSPVRLLGWAAIAGLSLLLIGLSPPLEDLLRVGRNKLHRHPASGDIVLVSIDNRSVREIGRWPWPRTNHARLVDRLTAAGAKRVYFDITFDSPSDPANDRALATAIERSGRVTLPVRGQSGPDGIAESSPTPLTMFSRHARLGSISVQYNYQNAVWRLPYSVNVNGKAVPSFAASLAGKSGTGDFPIDYSFEPTSIPSINAADVIAGRFDPRLVQGKQVIVGVNSEALGDQFFIPGVGKMGGVYVQMIGAETLKAGRPMDLGAFPALILAAGLVALCFYRRRPAYHNFVFAGGILGLLILPNFLEAQLIFVDVMPALFLLTGVWIAFGWRTMRKRGLVNAVSGLPNLSALRVNHGTRDQALIVARALNYTEIVAALPPDSERQLVDQIIGRLSVGSANRIFYQGDGGIFAWFEEGRKPFGHHIDALHALFRNPVRVSDLTVDLSISFGVELGSGRSPASRLASALVAADEAAHDGLKWKCHDPAAFEDASWRLSMLSQLDAAIDKGEVWIAFQPQLDLNSRRISGAEALARWTHPEKGPIEASEFVAAAEQHDRIAKLTDFVLEKAVAAAAIISKRDDDFRMAVNLSARLLTDKHLVMRVTALLARHGLDAKKLTLELTETSELADSGGSLETLSRLRDLGIEVSIDDYGTGMSTLEYLKKVPASEIKIDQSFVKGLADNRSDRLMVHSTIGLAHSLGRRVVAEGVEQDETLDALVEMGCDVAQGFIIGRPMSLESLLKRVSNDRRRVA